MLRPGFLGIGDYFHSTTEVHSLIIIRRKWQCKPPSSDKHMNTWICEWEPQRANVLSSGEVWARAVYIVESSCGVPLLSWFLPKNCVSRPRVPLSISLSVNAIKLLFFFQPLFVAPAQILWSTDGNLLIEVKSNQYDNLRVFHSPASGPCLCSPTRVIHFNVSAENIFLLFLRCDWHRTAHTSSHYLELYRNPGAQCTADSVRNRLCYRGAHLPCQSGCAS